MRIEEVKKVQEMAKAVKETGKGWEELYAAMESVINNTIKNCYGKAKVVNIDAADVESDVKYTLVKAVDKFNYEQTDVNFVQFYVMIAKQQVGLQIRSSNNSKKGAMKDYASIYATVPGTDRYYEDTLEDNTDVEGEVTFKMQLKDAIDSLQDSDRELIYILIEANNSKKALRSLLDAKYPGVKSTALSARVCRARNRLAKAMNM